MAETEAVVCYTCNADVAYTEFHAILYTSLSPGGAELSDVLVKFLLISDVTELSEAHPVICNACCMILQELWECSERFGKLRNQIWSLYKSAILYRNKELGSAIRGIEVQTDIRKDEINEIVEGCTVLENGDLIKTEHTDPSGIPVDERVSDEALREELSSDAIPHAKSPVEEDEKWPRWKRRPITCKICSKWFKTKAELQEHIVTHRKAQEQTSEEPEIEKRIPETRRSRKNALPEKKTRNSSETKHAKSSIVYKCKICAKELKSKTGAIYHAKSHSFPIVKVTDLDLVFHSRSASEADIPENGEETEVSKVKIQGEDALSSSDDEMPLAKHRTQLIYEKCKTDDALTETIIEKLEEEEEPTLVEGEIEIDSLDNGVDFSDSSQNDLEIEEQFIKFEGGEDGEYHLPRQGRPRKKLLMGGKGRKKVVVPKEPRFKCDICGKLWKTRGELNSHRTTHSDERPYICEICGQAYKHKPALDVHVSMHRGIYQHQCPYCQKAFTQKGALQRHLPIHTGDLPFQCELCGKRFVHRTSFSIHTMAHTGIRTIRCEICNLGVLSKSHLRRHMRIHSGEKPYECGTCGKAFAERYNLVAHQRIHDPLQSSNPRTQKKKPITCRICSAIFEKKAKLEEHMVAEHNKVTDIEEPQRQQNSRSSTYDSAEGFATPRFIITESTSSASKSGSHTVITNNYKREEAPSVDLSLRGVHGFRNIDILRTTLDNNRGLELIRMANGIVEAASHPWGGYSINPTS